RSPAQTDARPMSTELFWSLIATARADANTASEFASTLTEALVCFKPLAIKHFQSQLLDALAQLWSWDLWALVFMVRSGCSDDSFDYFLAWIVAQGESAYRAALEGPERLADCVEMVWDLQCEELLSVAEHAYFDRQGKSMPDVRTPKTDCRGTP